MCINKMYKTIDITKIYPVFQPIMDLNHNVLVGYESLLRHEDRIPPNILFDSARQQEEVFELDTYSILLTLSWLKPTFNNLIFLNVFPSTIYNKDFSAFLNKVSFLKDMYNYKIVFEVNEQEPWILNEPLFKESIKKIRSLGYYIALDDVNWSILTEENLFELKPDFIKIDREFSRNLSSDFAKQRFISRLVTESKGRTKIILEGLETVEDINAAKTLGISYGQGYKIGEPVIFPLNPDIEDHSKSFKLYY